MRKIISLIVGGFLFSNLRCSQGGNHPYADLAEFAINKI
jgi:hypothetical protein